MKKHKDKEHNYNFSVFDNYKCDGQLIMKFNNTNIEIVEESKDETNTLPVRV